MNFAPQNVVQADMGAYLSRTEFIADPDADRVITKHVTRFDGLVDLAKSMANEGVHGSKEMKLVGLYPPHMPEMCCQAWGITWQEFWSDPKWIKKMLNDPMLSDFRIAPGQY
jgi:hypothetical protein